ncbi:biopolymer transporter ExbD [Vibrio parahaemolyticus]|nr:biopolymer transporter ExbD [Vibrio parahaemolyticus]
MSVSIIKPPRRKTQGLSLVALMDIFTVLVFFLMFNVHSEQALEAGVNVPDLPQSTEAIDQLARDAQVMVLEVTKDESLYLDGQKIELDAELRLLTEQAKASCQEEGHAERCRHLAIEAPEAMPYSRVNRFVLWGRHLEFQDIYLVVTKKE